MYSNPLSPRASLTGPSERGQRTLERAVLAALRLLSVLLGVLAVLIALRSPPDAQPSTTDTAAAPDKVAQRMPR